MRRREFIALLGGAAAAWPLPARAQQTAMPVVGFLSGAAQEQTAGFVAAFVEGLKESGYVEGQNVLLEYRWANGAYERLPELAAELVGRRVAIIAAFGTQTIRATKAAVASSSIPVVFATGSDPVADGLVESLNHPGGNITGTTSIGGELAPKRLELIREVVPTAKIIGILINPNSPLSAVQLAEAETAAHATGQSLKVLTARNESEIEAVFVSMDRQVGALLISLDTFYLGQMERFASLAVRHALPAIAPLREFARNGGLMSYGTSISETYRQAGIYTGRILKGSKPSDLPIIQTTKVELVINLKAAKALGLTISLPLLGLADEVIE
jgi:putative tryptophan/tyrosine transport system substrate-binding protein